MPAAGPNIPNLGEKLALLVCTGKCKETIGVNLTHEQVKRLEEKEVMKYYKRYQTHVGTNKTEALTKRFLSFSTKALGCAVNLKDEEALKNELKNDYIIKKELSDLSDLLVLRFGRLLSLVSAFLIAAEHVDFRAKEPQHPSRDSDGYPLAGFDEVPTAKQCSENVE